MLASTLEDICAVVGYRVTRMLVWRYGGRALSVPTNPRPGHPLARLIGSSALRALSREWGGERLHIAMAADDQLRRNRHIADLIVDGVPVAEIAAQVGLTVRRVEQVRADLVEMGWNEYVDPGASGSAPMRDADPPPAD